MRTTNSRTLSKKSLLIRRPIREEDPQRTLPVMDLKRLLGPEVVNRAPDWPTNQGRNRNRI